MSDIDTLRSRAGRILYRELPEEYRYRDPATPGELGDLEAFLHGPGHLLDLIRATTAQAHADSFAEPVDGRSIQPWLLPYLAELVGAQLVAPDVIQRTAELNNSVGWYKSKGTLANVDSVSDVVAGTETVAREGWRHVLTTPRMGLPPFTSPPGTRAAEAMTESMAPKGTPDFRRMTRAVLDPTGANPLYRLRPRPDRPDDPVLWWKPLAPGGVPCFPGAYDDATVRTPDLRDPDRAIRVGPHPRRTLIHLRPPQGMFSDILPELVLDTDPKLAQFLPMDTNGVATFEAEALCVAAGLPVAPRLRVRLSGNLTLPKGQWTFRGLLFTGEKSGAPVKLQLQKDAQVLMEDCAAADLSVSGIPPEAGPNLTARNALFGSITAPKGWVELEYVTVTGVIDVARLNASDCIIADLGDTLICGAESPNCLRYSALGKVPDATPANCADLGGTNARARPHFLRLWVRDSDGCVFREAAYGEPGYGVLDHTTPQAVAAGAEDDGEMGAHHGHHHMAALRALKAKLADMLPLGQEIALFYDPMLALDPPVAV